MNETVKRAEDEIKITSQCCLMLDMSQLCHGCVLIHLFISWNCSVICSFLLFYFFKITICNDLFFKLARCEHIPNYFRLPLIEQSFSESQITLMGFDIETTHCDGKTTATEDELQVECAVPRIA